MGDKVYILVISVDLSCCRCRRAIQDYLCQLQRKQCMRILSIVYDEKNNNVLVSGPFDPEQLKRKLLCKLSKIINSIDIREPPKPPPKPDDKPPQPPPKPDESECIKKCKKECEEKCKKECEEKCKCKKECEEKCKCECERKCECECKRKCECECKRKCECECKRKCECKCKRKCKCKCKCKCERDCDCKKEDPPEPPPKPPKPPEPKPPMCPWPPQVTMVCCARPCPCFKPWSNCYICCSCGVESWPGMCGPSWGCGPSPGGRPPPWGNCESSQPCKIICESPAPPCSIM